MMSCRTERLNVSGMSRSGAALNAASPPPRAERRAAAIMILLLTTDQSLMFAA